MGPGRACRRRATRWQGSTVQITILYPPRTALCLSGGGLPQRVLRAGRDPGLGAAGGLLPRFHYLSTGVRGCYIGAFLSGSALARGPGRARLFGPGSARSRCRVRRAAPARRIARQQQFFDAAARPAVRRHLQRNRFSYPRNLLLNWFIFRAAVPGAAADPARQLALPPIGQQPCRHRQLGDAAGGAAVALPRARRFGGAGARPATGRGRVGFPTPVRARHPRRHALHLPADLLAAGFLANSAA